MGRDSFVFYKTFFQTGQHLGDQDRLAFYDALVAFGIDGVEVAESPIILALMESVKQAIVHAEKKYRASVENGKKGGRPKGSGEQEGAEKAKGKPRKTQGKAKGVVENLEEPEDNLTVDGTVPVPDSVPDSVPVNENENVDGAKKGRPTLEDVVDYCIDRQNGIDPVRFFNRYESVGWVIRGDRITDWQAVVRSWEKVDVEMAELVGG